MVTGASVGDADKTVTLSATRPPSNYKINMSSLAETIEVTVTIKFICKATAVTAELTQTEYFYNYDATAIDLTPVFTVTAADGCTKEDPIVEFSD